MNPSSRSWGLERDPGRAEKEREECGHDGSACRSPGELPASEASKAG